MDATTGKGPVWMIRKDAAEAAKQGMHMDENFPPQDGILWGFFLT